MTPVHNRLTQRGLLQISSLCLLQEGEDQDDDQRSEDRHTLIKTRGEDDNYGIHINNKRFYLIASSCYFLSVKMLQLSQFWESMHSLDKLFRQPVFRLFPKNLLWTCLIQLKIYENTVSIHVQHLATGIILLRSKTKKKRSLHHTIVVKEMVTVNNVKHI